MPARNINSVHVVSAGPHAAQHVTPSESCPHPNQHGRGGCPTPEHLWPIAVHEKPDPWVARRLEACHECQRRMRALVQEVETARLAFSEGRTSGHSAIFVAQQKSTDEHNQPGRDRASSDTPGDDAASDARASDSADSLTMIGKYYVLEMICDSGQATVFRGLHPSLLIEVVIKLAHVPWSRDVMGRARLISEAKALADLVHPHLARLYDLDFFEDRPFLVLEYVRGRHLRHYHESTAMSPSQIAFLVARVARAVAAAHNRGILHLDLKPENILVSSHAEPVLIDFGLSFLSRPGAIEGREDRYIAGTPQYMAPEQTHADPDRGSLTQRTDVYGLGGVLYYLCVGHDPFVVSRSEGQLQRPAEPDWRALERADVPARLKKICRKALSTAPESRYPSAASLATVLEEAGRRGTGTSRNRFRRMARWVLLAGIACLVAAIWVPAPSGQTRLMLEVVRAGRELAIADAIPFRPDDRVRLEGIAPESSQFALFAFRDGRPPQWLAPLSLSERHAGLRLAYPKFNAAVPLSTVGQRLLTLLVARRDAPIRQDDVVDCLAAVEKWPSPPHPTVVIFGHEECQIMTPRGSQLTGSSRTDLLVAVASLQARLAGRFDDFAGVLVLAPTGQFEIGEPLR